MRQIAKVQTSDIANSQMSASFPVSGEGGRRVEKALIKAWALIKFFSSEEGRSFEGGIYLGRGALSDNYGLQLIVTATANKTLNK